MAYNRTNMSLEEVSGKGRHLGSKHWHPFRIIPEGKKDAQSWVETASSWLDDEAKTRFSACLSVASNRLTQCNCFKDVFAVAGSSECVAEYLWVFGNRSPKDRDAEIMLQMRISGGIGSEDSTEVRFKVPFYSSAGQEDAVVKHLQQSWLCKNAFQHVFDLGRKKWRSLANCVMESLPPPRHHMVGKQSNRAIGLENNGVLDGLRLYFDHLSDLSEPRATRFVRELTGVALRDTDDTLDLPNHMTKRGLYRDYCTQIGWNVTCTDKGHFIYKERTDEEWTSSTDQSVERDTCPSWQTFRRFWKRDYPKLVITNPSKDTCDMCYKFYIQSRSGLGKLARNHAADQAQDDNTEETSSDSSEAEEEEVAAAATEPAAVDTNEAPRDRTASLLEKSILEAAQHVKESVAQRRRVVEIQALVRDQTKNKVPHEQRTYLYYFDYSQNVQCPFFGKEQPGETYYMSPLTINVFGINDGNKEQDHLYAYCYNEGIGTKGGNNVASMLMHHLETQGLLQDNGKHLVLVCDNCGGQNKNRMVLRTILFLVESGAFQEVTLLFLIAGHTKNACDRVFNLLKKEYRSTNLYSEDDLIDTFNKHSQCTALKPPPFLDYDSKWDSLYRNFKGIQKFHVFQAYKELLDLGGDARLCVKRSELPGATQKEYNPMKTCANREAFLASSPSVIPPPGIRAIKREELSRKLAKYVPASYRALPMYQAPPPEQLRALKEHQQHKKRLREENKGKDRS